MGRSSPAQGLQAINGVAFDSGAFSLDSFDTESFDLGVAVTCDVKVSWLTYDSALKACDVRVSWLAYDANSTPCQVQVSWLQFDAANDAGIDYVVTIARRFGRR